VTGFAIVLFLQQANNKRAHKVNNDNIWKLTAVIFFTARGIKLGKEKGKIVFRHENILWESEFMYVIFWINELMAWRSYILASDTSQDVPCLPKLLGLSPTEDYLVILPLLLPG
jgi:hypothetical protein